MEDLEKREKGRMEEQEQDEANRRTIKEEAKQVSAQKTEGKGLTRGIKSEIPFLHSVEAPFPKARKLSQEIKKPVSVNLFPQIPSFSPENPQQAKLSGLSLEFKLPSCRKLSLTVPHIHVGIGQRLKSVNLNSEFEFPRMPQISPKVPPFYTMLPQRTKSQKLEEAWSEPLSKAKSLARKWAENDEWAKLECCHYLRNASGTLDRMYKLESLSKRHRIDGEAFVQQLERETEKAGTSIAEVGNVAQIELDKLSERISKAIKEAPENIRWSCYSWALLREQRELVGPEAKDLIFPLSLASGLSEEETLQKLINLGLGVQGFHDARAYMFSTWEEHPATYRVLEDIRQRPENYGLQPPSMEAMLSRLAENEAFQRIVEFAGRGEIRQVESWTFQEFISSMDEEFGKGTFNNLSQKLLRCGVLIMGYSEGRRAKSGRGSTPNAYEIGFIPEAIEILRRNQPLPREEIETEAKEKEAGRGEGRVGTGVEDFFDLFLENRGSGHAIQGAISGGGPVVLIISQREGEEYSEGIKSLCSQIYREIRGGQLPHYHLVEEKDKIEEIQPSRRLIFTNLTDLSGTHERVLNRIRGFAGTREPGFFLFYLPEVEAYSLYERLESEIAADTPAEILHLGLRELSPSAKSSLLSLFWGFTNFDDVWWSELQRSGRYTGEGATFDQIFTQGERQFGRRLHNILERKGGLYREATIRSGQNSLSCDNGSQESDMHYEIKAFMVYYFGEKMELLDNQIRKNEKIQTEVDILEENPPHPTDVYIKDKNLAIEVETLFGQGISPLSKVDETVRRYSGKGIRLWIVLPNPAFLRYFEKLTALQRRYDQDNEEVGIYTLDLSQGKLLKIDEVRSILNKASRGVS